MSVLDDIRNGKGLKPIYVGYECATCENKNCTGHGLPTTEKVCDGYKHTTTNADRIRAMSDEKLASLFGSTCDCDNACCFIHHEGVSCMNGCEAAWLEWLKKEVEEECDLSKYV
jgi:hypothetical protein